MHIWLFLKQDMSPRFFFKSAFWSLAVSKVKTPRGAANINGIIIIMACIFFDNNTTLIFLPYFCSTNIICYPLCDNVNVILCISKINVVIHVLY